MRMARSCSKASGDGDPGAVLQLLREWISEESLIPLTPDQIDADANLCDAGYIDSVKSAEFLVLIGEHYEVFIPEADLVGKLSSLSAIVEHICATRRSGAPQ